MRYDVSTIKATECINNSISNSYVMRIQYDTHVFCSRCEIQYLRATTKLIPNWGYKCEKCGNKCRVKPKYQIKNYLKNHPFEGTNRRGRSAIHREIIELGKAQAWVE